MRDDELQPELAGRIGQQIQQRDGVATSGHRDDGLSRFREEALASKVREQPRGKRLSSGHVS